jgi:transcriptional regulator with XRE-family HTH domain
MAEMVRKPMGSESNMVLQLRELIQTDGRSLNQLAKDSGLDAGRLSRFLRGERDINFEAAARLCEVLGVRFVLPQRKPKAEAPPAKRKGKKR